ncbi:MAG: two-component system response regulator [Methylococcaceae bacterium]
MKDDINNYLVNNIVHNVQTDVNILIIDDVIDNIQVAMNILKEESYDLSYATDGEKALALLEQNEGVTGFDLILLDIMMPEMDGFEVCQKIKENPRTHDIPIIFLTAKVDVDDISKGFAYGAVDYISKPFHAEELLARARTHIQLYRKNTLFKENTIILGNKIVEGQNRLFSELEHNQKEFIWVLTELMEATSDETGKHIKRVAEISSLLAHYHPALNEEDEEILFHASPMHDIGKMTIPHKILHKPGRYTEEEFEIMKSHTTNAYKLLSGCKRKLGQAASIIAHEHHEKWNGKGYPRQLKKTGIHIYGRVVALADVFDALTHQRCYKDAWNTNEAINYIQNHRGTQFDPELVDIMLEHIEKFKKIILAT